ncbi:MAG: response regulator [Opitutae bacterium]|nr:response regulator [Opitutae bacterium]
MMPRDPYKYFRIEARELLDGLRRGVGELAGADSDPDRVTRLLRMAHTLKGASRVVRLPAVSELAHRIEGVLGPSRESAVPPTGEQQAELGQLVEAIAGHLAALDQPVTPVSPGPTAFGDSAAAPVLPEAVRLQISEVESSLSSVAGTSAEVAALREEYRGLERACQQARLVASMAGRTRSAVGRLPAEAGDLLAGLEGLRHRVGNRVDRIDRDLQRLHDETSRLRLIATEVLWAFLERTARDAAQSVGKRVRIETHSDAPRIDTAVFASVQEALLHLVRNAIVHGLEPETARIAAGKPREGVVRLRIEQEYSRLHVICEDDGRGIDVEAVRRAAVARGWLLAAAATPSSMEEAISLLLRGGLTTTATADEMSGRGIGLEVVRAAVSRVHGRLTIESVPNRGTKVVIEVPVALVARPVLAVSTGGVQWLLPLGSVVRVVRADSSAIRAADGAEELHDSGQVIFYTPLGRLVGGRARVARARADRITAVVIRGKHGIAAIGVDRLHGTAEAIIRPLPALADAAAFVVGAASDAGGVPRLAVEPEALIESIRRARIETGAETVAHLPVLIVDDSLTTRMLEQSILESAGYQVDAAVSGEEALERLRARRYGLLLVDVEMPGMDGFVLVERLRREPAWREIPAILVTSRESREDRARGLQVGAQDYVAKGEFDQRRLLARIGELLK